MKPEDMNSTYNHTANDTGVVFAKPRYKSQTLDHLHDVILSIFPRGIVFTGSVGVFRRIPTLEVYLKLGFSVTIYILTYTALVCFL